MNISSQIISMIVKAENTHQLEKEELVRLICTEDEAINREIFAAADRVRQKYVGDEVHLRALLEVSNICKQNCFYCGLRRDNKNVERYRLEAKTIIDLAKKAKSYGYRTVVIQSGEDDYYDADKMVFIIRKIKKLDVAVTLSNGEKSRQVYAEYKKAGADRYLLRIETTDQDLYERLDPQMNWERRVECLQELKDLGFELGTGCLVGLPGQMKESLADDILFFKNIGADMVGIGPFIANADTPLGGEPSGDFTLSTKVMALTRLLLPDTNIPATTAMESIEADGRIKALERGANVVMPNVTEVGYSRHYQLYPGKIRPDGDPAGYRACLIARLASLGRTVSQDRGASKHYRRGK